MFCKYFKSCVVVLIFIVSASGQMDLHLTTNQKSRISQEYYKGDLNNETSFDKRSRYLYKIIYSRPENLEIEVGQCKIQPLKIPDFAALEKHKLRISDIKCLEHLWKLRYYEEIDIANAMCDVEPTDNQMKSIVNLHIPDSQYSDHPHMGAIGWQKSEDTWLFICEGALISDKHVLTAASCTQLPQRYTNQVSDLKPKVVRFGVYDISDEEEVGKSPMDVLISEITLHPRYNTEMVYYDIAVIKIDKNLAFSSMIHPACIWTDQKVVTGNGLLTGWYDVESNKTINKKDIASMSSFNVFDRIKFFNKPKPGENKPNVPVNKSMMQLKKIELVANIVCQKLTQNKRSSRLPGILYQHQCGLRRRDKSCKLERGTILQAGMKIPEITDWKMHYVIGVRSFDFGCGRMMNLSVYSRAVAFIEWIENIVWPKKDE